MKERLGNFWITVVMVSTVVGVSLSVNQLFYLNLFGVKLLEEAYLYFLLTCFLSLAFIIFPAFKTDQVNKVKWYDAVLYLLTVLITSFMGLNAEKIIISGWEYIAPFLPTFLSILMWLLLLEALRRVAGLTLTLICLLFSLYPLIAGYVPVNFLSGQSFDFLSTARGHIMSQSSILGIPFRTLGNLLVGFMLFGVVITHTGGGTFFFNIAQSLFGRTRGGAAKVAVVGSAFFGMLSGSAISNTVTTGAMTIPAMKKAGFKSHFAAAVEATSSTGGTITPPIMGSAAFIMASFLNVPYIEIAMAAAIPAVLYFFALFVQVDGYAANNNLVGLPKAELPSFWKTLKDGWLFILALLAIVWLLAILSSEGQAAYYASAILLVLAMLKKETRLSLQKVKDIILDGGKILTEIGTIIAGVGFIVGALSMTGVAFSFSRELVSAAGDSVFLILVGGAITCFILGMGMTVSASYVFLAIIMAPALINLGIDPIAAHLFVLYWATVSFITPPVALAAYAAAGIAGASPMKTGFTAVRLGIVTFLIPFFMVYNPELIGRGDIMNIIPTVLTALVGIWVIASSFEGYLFGAGRMRSKWLRLLLGLGGLAMFAPGIVTDLIGFSLLLSIFPLIRNANQKSHLIEVRQVKA